MEDVSEGAGAELTAEETASEEVTAELTALEEEASEDPVVEELPVALEVVVSLSVPDDTAEEEVSGSKIGLMLFWYSSSFKV